MEDPDNSSPLSIRVDDNEINFSLDDSLTWNSPEISTSAKRFRLNESQCDETPCLTPCLPSDNSIPSHVASGCSSGVHFPWDSQPRMFPPLQDSPGEQDLSFISDTESLPFSPEFYVAEPLPEDKALESALQSSINAYGLATTADILLSNPDLKKAIRSRIHSETQAELKSSLKDSILIRPLQDRIVSNIGSIFCLGFKVFAIDLPIRYYLLKILY